MTQIILPQSVDVSSLDTRLLGRVKVLDSAGVVIDPAKEHSTAASPSSTRLSDGTTYLGSTAQRLHVDDGGSSLSVDDNGGSLTVDGTVTADTELPAASALADAEANPTVPRVGSPLLIYNGATWDRARAIPNAPGVVPATGLLAAATVLSNAAGTYRTWDVAGSNGDANPGSQFPSVAGYVFNGASYDRTPGDTSGMKTHGDVDHDAVNTGKLHQVGGHASPVDLPPTKVSAAGDRVRAWHDSFGATVVRRRKIRESYTAVFRLAQTTARLDQTFTHTANTNKQWATLHHLNTATKELCLMKVVVWVTAMTAVAPVGVIELRELTPGTTAPATGNPVITGRPRRVGTGAHEATALYLPTTQGSEAAVDSPLAHHVFDEAVSVATAAFAHPQTFETGGIVLLDTSKEDDQVMPPTVPVTTHGGWAVVSRLTGATATRLTVLMIFTEEIP